MASAHTAKRRRLSPSNDGSSTKPSRRNGASTNDFYRHDAEWDLEQDYEKRPRKLNNKEKEKTRLPIKTTEGALEHVEEPEVSEEESDNPFASDDGEDEAEEFNGIEEAPVEEKPPVPVKVQIIEAKEELARIAAVINEDPEEHIGSFKKLAEMVSSDTHPTVKKLSMATQAAVFRDVIPGYRIRPLGDEEKTAKTSKEVRKLRTFEQTLLSSYQNYVKLLSYFAKPPKNSDIRDAEGLKSAAINCACSLLNAVPHFNCRGDLLQILVGQLSRRQLNQDSNKCRSTLEEIFAKDEDGIVSMEAVRLLSKMMKAKEFWVHESVLGIFLHLRLLSEFSSKGSKDKVDKNSEDQEYKGKKIKMKREFRTKKERKLLRDQKSVAKDMKEADALAAHEQRDRMQAETLKLVFGTYFRILKLRVPHLMGTVLEGLAKYAHLINQDFFGDLLEALKDLISHTDESDIAGHSEGETGSDNEAGTDTSTRNTTREALLCSITAFALLEGQDASKAASSLHLDLSYFTKHLYQTLYPLSLNADIEYNPSKSLRLPDPNRPAEQSSFGNNNNNNKVNFQTPTVLLLRCLHSTLTAKGPNAPPPLRVAAFTKRLMTIILQLPEKSAMATLSLLSRVGKLHGRKIAALWNTEERKGDGVFNGISDSVEGSNAYAGTVWEGELLRMHYCPGVRDGVREMEKIIGDLLK